MQYYYNNSSAYNIPKYLSVSSIEILYSNGYNDGLKEGLKDKFEYGKNQKQLGYKEGIDKGTKEHVILDLMVGVVSVPVTILNSLFGPTIYSIPIMSVLVSFMGVGIIIYLIRKFW